MCQKSNIFTRTFFSYVYMISDINHLVKPYNRSDSYHCKRNTKPLSVDNSRNKNNLKTAPSYEIERLNNK